MCKSERKNLIEKYKDIEENKKRILDELKRKKLLYVDDNIKKDSNVCIILSCPGQEELKEDKVCAGDTGKNLERILGIVKKSDKDTKLKKSKNYKGHEQRYAYTIINSVRKVYFRGYNRAEPTEREVKNKNNVKRVDKKLSKLNLDYFILCGNNAEILFNEIKGKYKDAEVARVSHIGWVGLRNEYNNSCEELKNITKPSDRDKERLEIVAKKIIKELGL